jgi:hypothetical protein
MSRCNGWQYEEDGRQDDDSNVQKMSKRHEIRSFVCRELCAIRWGRASEEVLNSASERECYLPVRRNGGALYSIPPFAFSQGMQ